MGDGLRTAALLLAMTGGAWAVCTSQATAEDATAEAAEPGEPAGDPAAKPAGDAAEPGASAGAATGEATNDRMDKRAKEHFDIGRTLYASGRFEDAGEEFSKAYELSKRPQLLYNVYVAYRDAHDFPKAIVALRAYLEKVPDAKDRINLEARLKAMEKAQAERDAEAEARAASSEADDAGSEAPTEPRRSWVPLALIGGGAGMLAASIGTGVATLTLKGKLSDNCTGNVCPEGEQSKIDRAKALAVATDVLLFGGAAVLGTGIILRLTGVLDEDRESPVALGCGPTGCVVQVKGQF